MPIYKHNPSRAFISLCAAALMSLSFNGLASAKDNSNRKVSKKTGKVIMKAMEQISSRDYEAGIAQLEGLLAKPNLSPYERSTAYQINGQAYYELKQVPLAIQSFENAISAGGLSSAEMGSLRLTIAKLYSSDGQYLRAAETIEAWTPERTDRKLAKIEFLMQTWMQAGEYERALPFAERWFDETARKQRKHYDTLVFLHHTLGRSETFISRVKDIIAVQPDNKIALETLENLYAAQGNEKLAFDVAKQKYEQGLMRYEREILYLVKRHAFYNDFGTGASLLHKEIKAETVSKKPRNLVYLSQLYEMSGQSDIAASIFQSAVDLSNIETARALKKDAASLSENPVPASRKKQPPRPSFLTPKKKPSGNFKINPSDRDAQPIARIPPVMPEGATTSGHCRLRFNVTAQGHPFAITATSCTEDIFKQPAIGSVEKWRFNPKVRNGKVVPRTDVETKINFRLADK